MPLRRPMLVLGVLSLALLGIVGCGGHKKKPQIKTLTYRSGVALDASVTDDGSQGNVRYQTISYTSVDGQRVPALMSIPTDRTPLGCLVYQGGFALAKEQSPGLRTGAVALRLATFTIDPRNVGARGSVDQALAAVKQPEALAAMVADTAVDVRVGLDYLETRPECRGKIAYMGTSFGAVVGAIVSGQDQRIASTVLTSIGPTFERGIIKTNQEAERDPAFTIVEAPGALKDPKIMAHALSILSPYDPARWVGRIAPRPLMLVNGRDDPLVSHADALAVAQAAREPKTVLYAATGHDPFEAGAGEQTATAQVAEFLVRTLGLTKHL